LRNAVCLTIFGDPNLTDFLLRVIALLCRCPVIVAGATARGILDACTGLGATLLIERDGLSKSALAAIDAGVRRDSYFLVGSQLLSAFGPKIIAGSESGARLESLRGGLAIPLSALEDPCWGRLSDPRFVRPAAELRNRLVGFEFEGFDAKRIADDAGGLSFASRSLITSVMVEPFAGDIEFCKRLAADIADFEVREFEKLPPEIDAVMSAFFFAAHDAELRTDGEVSVKGITKLTNNVLEELGENFRVKPRRVGGILGRLGFPRCERSAQGYFMSLSVAVLELIHRQAGRHQIFDANPYDPQGPRIECPLCRKHKLVPGYTGKGYESYERGAKAREERREEIKRQERNRRPVVPLVTEKLLKKLVKLESPGGVNASVNVGVVKGAEAPSS
jgi:hypothetical protein